MTGSNANDGDQARPPMACDLSTLDAAQRARRAQLAKLVRGNTKRVVELANGYQLLLRLEDELARELEELVGLERKCCPFLAIGLRHDETTGEAVLEISGNSGAKEFIAAEVGIVD